MQANCVECGTAVEIVTRAQQQQLRRGRPYCSTTCRDAHAARGRAASLAATNRRGASARMKAKNPMHDPDVRARMSKTLRTIGHRPKVRQGNGAGPTKPQAMLREALGPEWVMEHAVPTGPARDPGMPKAYKIDIANPSTMVAVEVDGSSHHSLTRKEQDRVKTAFLVGRGWSVLRFWNREILADVEACRDRITSTTSRSPAPTPTSPTAS